MGSRLNYVLCVTDTFEAGDREDVIMHIGFSDENYAFEYAKRLASELMARQGLGDRMFIETTRNGRGVLSCCVSKYRDRARLEWACRMTVEPVVSPAKADVVANDKILV